MVHARARGRFSQVCMLIPTREERKRERGEGKDLHGLVISSEDENGKERWRGEEAGGERGDSNESDDLPMARGIDGCSLILNFPMTVFSDPPLRHYALFLRLFPSVALSPLSLEERQVTRRLPLPPSPTLHPKGVTSVPGLCERRGKVRPATGTDTLAAGNLNLNPDRGRSRAVTDPGICIPPARERG